MEEYYFLINLLQLELTFYNSSLETSWRTEVEVGLFINDAIMSITANN